MKSTFEKMGGTYTLGADGIYYSNLVSTDEEPHYGKYGMMRKTYLKEHRPAILNTPLSTALIFPSSVNGRQTDIHAIPAHIALGSPSSETISIALETISVSFRYHWFLADRTSNSRNKSLNVLR